jgi:hypothetical protein
LRAFLQHDGKPGEDQKKCLTELPEKMNHHAALTAEVLVPSLADAAAWPDGD